MTKAISPQEVIAQRESCEHIPDFVFEAVNKLIQAKFNGSSARFDQNQVIDAILKESDGTHQGTSLTRQHIFDNKWLNFEAKYREQGWSVDYDKPAYNESYTAFFVFSVKK